MCWLTYGVRQRDQDDGQDDDEPPASMLEIGQMTQQ